MKKTWLLLASFVIMAFALCGCEKQKEVTDPDVIYTFGQENITYGEFYIYAKMVEEDYQKRYGKGIWELAISVDDEESTVKEVTIKDIISSINRVKVLSKRAEEMGISLSDTELDQMNKDGEAFYNGLTEKDVADTGLTEETIQKVMKDNLLAKKVYKSVIDDYGYEISDEDARMTTFYDMIFECYKLDEEGESKEFSEEKKEEQKKKADEALKALASKENTKYEDIVSKYDLEYASSYTMSKEEIIEEYGESVAEKILSLSDGEISPVIESKYGYHIFVMQKSNDEELTKKNKAEIIDKKQKEYFKGLYEEWEREYDAGFDIEESVNYDLIKDFPFN